MLLEVPSQGLQGVRPKRPSGQWHSRPSQHRRCKQQDVASAIGGLDQRVFHPTLDGVGKFLVGSRFPIGEAIKCRVEGGFISSTQ